VFRVAATSGSVPRVDREAHWARCELRKKKYENTVIFSRLENERENRQVAAIGENRRKENDRSSMATQSKKRKSPLCGSVTIRG
jgi:hypothetical protein